MKAWDAVEPPLISRSNLSVYRRFLTAHIWGIYQRNFDELEKKAESVKWAQRFYVDYLVTIMVMGVALTASAATIARRPNHLSVAPASLRTETQRTDAGARG